jgi:hypothetical protein
LRTSFDVFSGGANSDCDDEGSVVYVSSDDVGNDDQQNEDCPKDIEDDASSVTALGGVPSSDKTSAVVASSVTALGGVPSSDKTSAVKSKSKRKKEKEVISRRELRTQREDILLCAEETVSFARKALVYAKNLASSMDGELGEESVASQRLDGATLAWKEAKEKFLHRTKYLDISPGSGSDSDE